MGQGAMTDWSTTRSMEAGAKQAEATGMTSVSGAQGARPSSRLRAARAMRAPRMDHGASSTMGRSAGRSSKTRVLRMRT